METAIAAFLELVNETLAAAIVVIASSLLLYNLTRNFQDVVARTSAVVLGCVTAAYVTDVFAFLGPSQGTLEAVFRLQWLGIAFMPTGMFHLSDALLATTGLPSRGRRRRVIRILYLISAAFLMLAAFTNALIQPVRVFPEHFESGIYVSLRAGPLFPIYIAYFVIVIAIAFFNVQRARRRCLTRNTRRRMGYLQIAFLTPAVGIFPFSVLLGPGQEFSPLGLLMVNFANLFVVMMLLFLAYPLSFFSARIPDRVVKSELLRFLLRGPATALLALVTILFTTPATRILGLPGQSFMPFAVVAIVLVWQWFVAIALPYIEKWLVYSGEDADELTKLQDLSERLLTQSDLYQLLEANLAASCDYLRVSTAFVATLGENENEIVAAVGPTRPTNEMVNQESPALLTQFESDDAPDIIAWHAYWMVPLYSKRRAETGHTIIGVMGIQARAAELDLDDDERAMLTMFAHRSAQTLDDMTLQTEIVGALSGLLPQIKTTRASTLEVEYSPRRNSTARALEAMAFDQEQFTEQVRAALRHYWGGPGLSSSRLLELNAVQAALLDNDDNPSKALRAVLGRAIESLKPEGERKLLSPEWTLYNILDLRFIQRVKVRDVALRLALSEPDLYRKQRVAIDAVASALLELEQSHRQANTPADA